jgi:hypothetical protein
MLLERAIVGLPEPSRITRRDRGFDGIASVIVPLLCAMVALPLASGTARAQWPAIGLSYGGPVHADGTGNIIINGLAKRDTTGALLWSLSPGWSNLRVVPDGAGGSIALYHVGQPWVNFGARVSTSGTIL